MVVVTKTGENVTINSGNMVTASEDKPSIRQQVYGLYLQKADIKPKQACGLLGLNYYKHGNYVRKLLCMCRKGKVLPSFGRVLRVLNSVLHRRIFDDRLLKLPRPVVMPGWFRASPNKNRQWVFKCELGSVKWFPKGSFMVELNSKHNRLGHAKQLVCKCFGELFSFSVLNPIVESLSRFEKSQHWVFDCGGELPKFCVDVFRESHGLVIGSDGSHKGKLEVHLSKPFWLGSFESSVSRVNRGFDRLFEGLVGPLGRLADAVDSGKVSVDGGRVDSYRV